MLTCARPLDAAVTRLASLYAWRAACKKLYMKKTVYVTAYNRMGRWGPSCYISRACLFFADIDVALHHPLPPHPIPSYHIVPCAYVMHVGGVTADPLSAATM